MSAIQSSEKLEITESLVTDLIAEQFPQWAHLPIEPVKFSGWDNKTFRLGSDMSMRLPSAQCYAAQVTIEQKWLPILAPRVSISIPTPLAMGQPCKDYPFNWSVYRWIEGDSANSLIIEDIYLQQIALDLSRFLNELHTIDISGAPVAGSHNFWRGGSLSVYDAETKLALAQLKDFIDVSRAAAVWQKALSSQWNNNPVWIHGDLSAGNILIQHNQLVAVIDFGCMAVGDPACDLVIAWTLLKNESRNLFKSQLNVDSDTWARARGWALWKALITLSSLKDKSNSDAMVQRRIVDEILHEHEFLNDF